MITDFVAGKNGDVLDLKDLLQNAAVGFDGANPFGNGYLKLVQQGADTWLQFDADGSGGTSSSYLTIAVLQNVTVSSLTLDNFAPGYPPDGREAPGVTSVGTAQSDTLLGGVGNDSLSGLGGNDSLDGSFGNDTLYGGSGDDTLKDSLGDNVFDGGDGNDFLQTQSATATQTLLGGAGDDRFEVAAKSAAIDGGDGNDRVSYAGYVSLNSSDRYFYGDVTILGGNGNDVVDRVLYANRAIVKGEGDDDYLSVGYSKFAQLEGGAGSDTLIVEGTNSAYWDRDTDPWRDLSFTLDGGTGNDTLSFTPAADASPEPLV